MRHDKIRELELDIEYLDVRLIHYDELRLLDVIADTVHAHPSREKIMAAYREEREELYELWKELDDFR